MFPPGAVAANQEITVGLSNTLPVSLPAGYVLQSAVLELLPHGTGLSANATVTLPLVAGASGPYRYMRLANASTLTWTDEDAASAGSGSVSFSINQFSYEAAARAPNTECVPNCGAQNCGLDPVCGASCGSCSNGNICSPTGTCTPCTPDCTGKSCGNNGCGGSCGSCDTDLVCSNGACVTSWTELDPPCTTQPLGSVNPMVGGCSERGYRSAFTVLEGTGLTEAWSFAPSGIAPSNGKYMNSPVIDDAGMVFVSRADGVWAVYEGHQIWELRNSSLSNTEIVGPPVVVGDKVVFATTSGVVYAREAATGAAAWSTSVEDPNGFSLTTQYPLLPFVHDGNVVLHAYGKVWTLDGDTGAATSFDYVQGSATNLDPALRGTLLVSADLSNNIVKGMTYPAGTELWNAFAYTSRRNPVTFLPATTAQPNVSQGDVLIIGKESAFGVPFLRFINPATGAYRKINNEGADLLSNHVRLELAAFNRIAVNSNNKALIANGSFASGPITHCLVDLAQSLPGTFTCETPFTTPVGVTAQPVAMRDDRFAMVDLAGTVHVVPFSSPGTKISYTLTGTSLPDASDDQVAGTPVVGADGTLYVTFGKAGGKLFAVRAIDAR